MLFIESPEDDDELALLGLIQDAHDPVEGGPAPVVSLGRAMHWNRRRFRELCLTGIPTRKLEQEDSLHRNWRLPRARLLLGSCAGDVFTTPPVVGQELAARVKEGGRCGRESMVRPFRDR